MQLLLFTYRLQDFRGGGAMMRPLPAVAVGDAVGAAVGAAEGEAKYDEK